MMDALTLVLIFFAIIFGFLIGKYITERIKWSDKKKLLEERWERQLLEMQKDSEAKLEKLENTWKLKYSTELGEIKEMIQRAEKYMRQDAVKRSRRTLLGKLWEQVSPYIPKFPFHPSDMKFLGAPIDFVIFDGMGGNDIKQVVFLEVKSGDSKLNAQERRLKDVVESGKVKWKMFNIEKPEEVKIEATKDEDIDEGTSPHIVYEHIDNKIQEIKEESVNEDELEWECDYCGKGFETKEECDSHEKTCSERR